MVFSWVVISCCSFFTSGAEGRESLSAAALVIFFSETSEVIFNWVRDSSGGGACLGAGRFGGGACCWNV